MHRWLCTNLVEKVENFVSCVSKTCTSKLTIEIDELQHRYFKIVNATMLMLPPTSISKYINRILSYTGPGYYAMKGNSIAKDSPNKIENLCHRKSIFLIKRYPDVAKFPIFCYLLDLLCNSKML